MGCGQQGSQEFPAVCAMHRGDIGNFKECACSRTADMLFKFLRVLRPRLQGKDLQSLAFLPGILNLIPLSYSQAARVQVIKES